MTRLVDGHTMGTATGECSRWVDLADAEDGVEDNLDFLISVQAEGRVCGSHQTMSVLQQFLVMSATHKTGSFR